MFTGIIKEMGKVVSNLGTVVWIESKLPKIGKGDSIAVNGVCLTATKRVKKGKSSQVRFDLSEETLDRTTFRLLMPGQRVNIEPALSAADGLGGHIVQGHVDGVGQVASIEKSGENRNITFQASKDIMNYIVPKGSITIDGVSLTAVDVKDDRFSVAFIPYTLENTTIGTINVGDSVNLEIDVIAKYVAKYVQR